MKQADATPGTLAVWRDDVVRVIELVPTPMRKHAKVEFWGPAFNVPMEDGRHLIPAELIGTSFEIELSAVESIVPIAELVPFTYYRRNGPMWSEMERLERKLNNLRNLLFYVKNLNTPTGREHSA